MNSPLPTNDESPTTSFSLIVYNEEHARLFFAAQYTIDSLLAMPHTSKSRDEMFNECRRIYSNNEPVLTEINTSDQLYQGDSALQWYSHDPFLFEIVNQLLRSNNVNTMFNLRYFLKDLYTQLNELHEQETAIESDGKHQREKVYRDEPKSLKVAFVFASSMVKAENVIPILFCMEIN